MDEIIKGNKIYLRKFQKGDEIFVFKWKKDPDVARFLTRNPEKDINDSIRDLNKYLEEYKNPLNIRFAIVYKENNEVVGSINICRFHDDVPEVGYVAAKDYWGKGLMSESLSLFINHLISRGYNRILIHADIFNIGSNLVIVKNGFRYLNKFKTIFEEKQLKCVLNEYEFVLKERKPKLIMSKTSSKYIKKILSSVRKDLTISLNENLNIGDYVLCEDENNHHVLFSIYSINKLLNDDKKEVIDLFTNSSNSEYLCKNFKYVVRSNIVLIY